jgi:hypothetical protein
LPKVPYTNAHNIDIPIIIGIAMPFATEPITTPNITKTIIKPIISIFISPNPLYKKNRKMEGGA